MRKGVRADGWKHHTSLRRWEYHKDNSVTIPMSGTLVIRKCTAYDILERRVCRTYIQIRIMKYIGIYNSKQKRRPSSKELFYFPVPSSLSLRLGRNTIVIQDHWFQLEFFNLFTPTTDTDPADWSVDLTSRRPKAVGRQVFFNFTIQVVEVHWSKQVSLPNFQMIAFLVHNLWILSSSISMKFAI